MYTSFRIQNFRCLRDMPIEQMAQINLIAGQNNVGKTALLEALWLHSGPTLPELGNRLSRFRGITELDPKRLLADLFYGFDPTHPILLSAGGDWNDKRRILKVTSQPLDRAPMPAPGAKGASLPLPPRGSQEPEVTAMSSSTIVFEYTDEAARSSTSSGYCTRSALPVAMGPDLQVTGEAHGFVSQGTKLPPRPSAVFLSARRHADPETDANRFGEVELEGHADSMIGGRGHPEASRRAGWPLDSENSAWAPPR